MAEWGLSEVNPGIVARIGIMFSSFITHYSSNSDHSKLASKLEYGENKLNSSLIHLKTIYEVLGAPDILLLD